MRDQVDTTCLGFAGHTRGVDLIMRCGVEPANYVAGDEVDGVSGVA
jgi:hypothetical protein